MLTARLLLVGITLAFASCTCNEPIKKTAADSPEPTTKNITAPATGGEVVPANTIVYTTPAQEKRQSAADNSGNTEDLVVAPGFAIQFVPITEELKSIGKTFQSFTIDNDSDITLTCKEGTVIKINANSFVLETGKAVTGKVDIRVKEFYALHDMLIANLTTRSGDRILETGGMLYIEANAGGEPCKIRDGMAVGLRVPYKEKKEGMQLFSGEWKNDAVDWALLEEDVYVPFNDMLKVQEYVVGNIRYPMLDTALGVNMTVEYDVTEEGKIDRVIIKTPAPQAFKDAATVAFRKMPPVNPATKNGVPVRSTQTMRLLFLTGLEGLNTMDSARRKQVEAGLINDWRPDQLNSYIFSASRLGWINIDRFYDERRPLINFAINTGPYEDLDVKLIFTSYNAITQGEKTRTGAQAKRIPEGEPLKLVVIKKYKGTNYFASKSVTSGRYTVDDLQFEPMSLETLDKELKKLSAAR
ncbi:MAG TPA: energy transducer TonB [Chitinophagaceae bacterium]|nr:energy transducer TonB [Chitinophagaceae bacterium]